MGNRPPLSDLRLRPKDPRFYPFLVIHTPALCEGPTEAHLREMRLACLMHFRQNRGDYIFNTKLLRYEKIMSFIELDRIRAEIKADKKTQVELKNADVAFLDWVEFCPPDTQGGPLDQIAADSNEVSSASSESD
jgi:hypothetical protein